MKKYKSNDEIYSENNVYNKIISDYIKSLDKMPTNEEEELDFNLKEQAVKLVIYDASDLSKLLDSYLVCSQNETIGGYSNDYDLIYKSDPNISARYMELKHHVFRRIKSVYNESSSEQQQQFKELVEKRYDSIDMSYTAAIDSWNRFQNKDYYEQQIKQNEKFYDSRDDAIRLISATISYIGRKKIICENQLKEIEKIKKEIFVEKTFN